MENIQNTSSDTSIGQLIAPYLRVWPWLILSVFIALLGAFLYLRYTAKSYQASASIIIKDTQGGGGFSELSTFQDIGVLGSSGNSLANEIEILTSKRLVRAVVNELHLGVQILQEGNIKITDVYTEFPYAARFIDDVGSSPKDRKTQSIYLKTVSDSSFAFKLVENEPYQEFNFDTPLLLPQGSLFLTPKSLISPPSNFGREYVIKMLNAENLVSSIASRLQVSTGSRGGSVLNLSLTDNVLARAVDILNELVIQYNADAINDKNLVATNTARFIEERIEAISVDLDSVENTIQDFKTSNNISNIEAQSQMNLDFSSEFTKRLIEAESELQVGNFLQQSLQSTPLGELLPGNVGLQSLEINTGLDQYNRLALRYQELLKTSTELNPTVIQYRDQLTTLRNSILSSLSGYLSALRIKRNALSAQESKVDDRIAEVPEAERVFRGIARNQTIIESIYLFLVTKREETAISLAVTAPKAKVVDAAWGSTSSIAPKSNVIYSGALISGLLIPLAFVYLMGLFNNKIENRKDVTNRLSNTPFLGEVPELSSDESDMIEKNDRSVLAESFRILRTNLQYKLSALGSSVKSPVVIVTSSVKGEGKTFVSFNLAMTMANSGKNVLLIGGDIRNPQLHRYLEKGSKNLKGVTEFLVYPEYKPEELIHESDANPNLKIFLSGAIPPNPAELWMSSRVDELLAYGKANYDVVIIDSAPSMLVTDTLLISDKADVTVYVARANYTEKPLLDFVSDTIESEKLKNVAMVLNNVKIANFGYGNKYAYSYGVDQDSAWTRLMKTLKFKK
ncbi:capsular exopolysaccharide family [Nonlabens sp. Hel1_33_55]|uniref:GumC family protein n=1 Tax=Nonlabens sp. Hel1_33_55 TaxID=1336802 RepID=UPI000875C714|nr:tyrosine-protein kinase [Nonlabens sp. Hel1_33_55]SCX94819.1 capsular exopolysaccharide family [Nonlabens sp. Hel1_33_55]